jgi:hypothetical protein
MITIDNLKILVIKYGTIIIGGKYAKKMVY